MSNVFSSESGEQKRRDLTFLSQLFRVDLPCQPTGFAPGKIALAKEAALPEYHRVFHVEHPYRTRGNVQDALAVWVEDVWHGYTEKVERFAEE